MIRVVAVAGLVTVQDAGRPGFLHLGIPRGGALVSGALARANAAVGNEPGAAALEVFGRITIEASVPLRVASDTGAVMRLAAGERATFATERARVRYVAFAGGVDVPVRLGSRSTLLVAGFGGFAGRALRSGDALALADARADGAAARSAIGAARASAGERDDASFRLWPGTEPGTLDGAWTIGAASDRVGVRLDRTAGALPSPAALAASVPMLQGAIQVPPDGRPIVLGPDHPVTGGYPVLGFLDRADFDRFFARPVGSTVHFEPPC